MVARLVSVLALVTVAQSASVLQKATPVEKVIGLLEKLQEETQEEGATEATGYDKFACFCKAQADTKLKNIAECEAKITRLSARIKKLGSEITQLSSSVKDSNKEIKKLEKECEEEADLRADDHHEFTIKNADITEAVRGCEAAIEQMEASKAAAFLQTGPLAEMVSDVLSDALERNALHPTNQEQAKAIASFLEVDPAQAKMDKAMGSKFHSNEIIENLMNILKDFKVQKNKIETAEMEKKHTFDMAQQSRNNQLQAFRDQVARTEEIIANKEDLKNKGEKDKDETKADKDADQTFLDELVKECEKTANSFDQRSKSRSNELMAIAEALEILKGKIAAKYGANKKLNLLSTGKSQDEISALANAEGHWVWVPTLLQTQLATVEPASRKAFEYLSDQAQSLNSPTLSTLVLKMKGDHFKKVRDMIKDLIAKLEADAEAEQSQKGWCDEEMEKATSKRDENIGAMEGDIASISKTKASIDSLTTEVAELEIEIADLYNALNEATDLRKAQKAENDKTVADATAGLNAVKAAIKVLKDFYENSFAQVSEHYTPPKGDAEGNTVGDLAPKTGFANEDYKGNQDAASGIIGMMEIIKSDFKGTIEATEDAEKEAENEFKDFKSDTEGDLDEKKDLVDKKKRKIKRAKADHVGYKDDLKEHGDLKKEALDELSKLKPACVGTGMDYAERVARREQEIESLKSAYLIFDDMGFLQKK